MKTVYKFDGTPAIIRENLEYDFEYTETPPPEGIYSPFFFDGVEWIGTSEEEFLKNNSIKPYEPTNGEIQQAQTQMQLTKTAVQLQATQKELANAMQEIAKLKGEI
ncbi:hypothetical protein [Staphylococcus cohnii]